MENIKGKIFLTGVPGVGKSTLLQKIVDEIHKQHAGICTGMITEEVRRSSENKRVGFKIGRTIIAHQDMNTETRVGRYGVDVSEIDKLCFLQSGFLPKKHGKSTILYLDEIGEMQLHSNKFKSLVKNILARENLSIMTLSSVYHSRFTNALRKRDDVTIIEVTEKNREELSAQLSELIVKKTG